MNYFLFKSVNNHLRMTSKPNHTKFTVNLQSISLYF